MFNPFDLYAYYVNLALLSGALGGVYLFLFWNLGHWRKRGVRTATSYPLIGSFPSAFTQRRNVAIDIDEIYRKYKKAENFIGVFMTRAPQLLILKPEYVHKIYVNGFKNFHDNEFSRFVDKKTDKILANNPFSLAGDEWRVHRLEITPTLTPHRIKMHYPTSLDVCQRLIQFIKAQQKMDCKDGIDTIELCLRYTTDVVTETAMGIRAESLSDNPTPIFDYTKRMLHEMPLLLFYQFIAGVFPVVRDFYKLRFFSKDVQHFFHYLLLQTIELRRSKKVDRSDFLSHLLQLSEKKNWSTGELSAHVMTYLVDGYLTTATTISHCFLMLARNPAAQQRVREEVTQNLNADGHLNFEALSEKLPYLEACIHETLRIFPSLLFVNKLCTRPYDLVNKDGQVLKLQKGDVVMISTYSLHHDEAYYEKPETFKPERFLPENGGVRKYREQGVYLGFGDGPRVCLGMRFALTQAKSAIAEVLKHFYVKPNPKTRTDNFLDKTSFLGCLEGGIWLDFEPIR